MGEKSPEPDGNWTVNEVECSGSTLLESMALGINVVKSMYSPLIIRSLIFAGMGGRV